MNYGKRDTNESAQTSTYAGATQGFRHGGAAAAERISQPEQH